MRTVKNHQIKNVFREEEEFQNYTKTLRSVKKPSEFPTGELSDRERTRLQRDVGRGIRYIVFSYDTPIAWVTSDGVAYIVNQDFEGSTGQHKSFLT